jgi:hypothetical protein
MKFLLCAERARMPGPHEKQGLHELLWQVLFKFMASRNIYYSLPGYALIQKYLILAFVFKRPGD